MKLEPKILYELHGLEQGLQKILIAAAIALALLALLLAIVEAVRRPRAAFAWLGAAAAVAGVVASVLVATARPAGACDSGVQAASGARFDGRVADRRVTLRERLFNPTGAANRRRIAIQRIGP